VAFAQQLTPRANEIRLDGLVLAFTLGTALLTAVLLSFAPRLGMEGALAASLASSGHRTTSGRGRQFLQRALVVTQLAVCVLLLTGAGLLLRTLTKLQTVETGARVENVLTMELPIEGEGIPDAEKLAMYERMRDRISSVPDVVEAGLGSNVPLRSAGFALEVKAEGRALRPGEPPPQAEYRTASPEYFRAAGIPLLRGREFTTTDRGAGARFVIINKSLADRLFPNQDPLGRRAAWTGEVLKFIPVSGDWRTVVGVVGDTRDAGLDTAPTPVMFQPFAQEVVFTGSLVIRTRGDAATLAPTVRRLIRELYPQQLVENVMTLEQVRDVSVAPRRLNAVVISLFAALALLIAAVGIAAVLAFSVGARMGEIGIRMSLGATSARVQRMVLAEGGVLIATGLAIGLAGSFATTQLMTGLLFGVPANDPFTIAGVLLVMAAVSVAACWIPAARAARVDPAVTLRNQ
jgi:putative ABC transport system permease protein